MWITGQIKTEQSIHSAQNMERKNCIEALCYLQNEKKDIIF